MSGDKITFKLKEISMKINVMKKFIFALLSIYLFPIYSLAGNEAMFGLNFGQTPKEIRALGSVLTFKYSKKNFSSYTCTSLPKNFSLAERYILIFSDDSLVKITMIGNTISKDIYGSDGKEAFINTFELLKNKYSIHLFRTDSGLKLYDEPDEFYQCLAYDGCGLYAAILKNDSKTVTLQLKGLERGKGYLIITAEAVPEFEKALKKEKLTTNKGDLDAF